MTGGDVRMSGEGALATDPRWTLRFEGFDAANEGRREALAAVGNGVFVVRGAASWARCGAPHYPGTYRAGLFATTSTAVGDETMRNETIVNLPNPFRLTWRREGEENWFDIRDVTVEDYEHVVDLRRGISVRRLVVRYPDARSLAVREERFVSMAQPHRAAQRVTLAGDLTLEVAAGIDAAVENANVDRYVHEHGRHFAGEGGVAPGGILHFDAAPCGAQTRVRTAALPTSDGAVFGSPVERDGELLRVGTARPGPNRPVAIDTLVAWSVNDSKPPEDLEGGAGYERLRELHADAWAELWDRFCFATDDPRHERHLRVLAFHLLQTLSPHSAALDVGVPARGWHGEGYRGHMFWDEVFVIPVLATRLPEVARSILMYRYRRLDAARRAARHAGFEGAMYPWRSATSGEEVTPRFQLNLLNGQWMEDHTRLQRHVGAAIAVNVRAYTDATGDRAFVAGPGGEMTLEIARFFASLAREAPDGHYDIDGVLGPDEYHTAYPGADQPGLRNNAYTNIMASWVLAEAAALPSRLSPDEGAALAAKVSLEEGETLHWERISRRLRLCLHESDEGLVISQFQGFGDLKAPEKIVLPEEYADARLDWALHAIGDSANAYQATKQADILSAVHILGPQIVPLLERMGLSDVPALLRRTAKYALARTTHQSSLSYVVYAGAASFLELDFARDHLEHAMGTDLCGLKGERTAEGIHLAAMAGTFDVLQKHVAGIWWDGTSTGARDCLPGALSRVEFRIRIRGRDIVAEIRSAPDASGASGP